MICVSQRMVWVIVRNTYDGSIFDLLSYHSTQESALLEVEIYKYRDAKAKEAEESYIEYLYDVREVKEESYSSIKDVETKMREIDASYETKLEQASSRRVQRQVEKEVRMQEELQTLRSELTGFINWWNSNDPYFEEKRLAACRRIKPIFERYLMHNGNDIDMKDFFAMFVNKMH